MVTLILSLPLSVCLKPLLHSSGSLSLFKCVNHPLVRCPAVGAGELRSGGIALSKGCAASQACAHCATARAEKSSLRQGLKLNPGWIKDSLR